MAWSCKEIPGRVGGKQERFAVAGKKQHHQGGGNDQVENKKVHIVQFTQEKNP